jgi:hypothetical protein
MLIAALLLAGTSISSQEVDDLRGIRFQKGPDWLITKNEAKRNCVLTTGRAFAVSFAWHPDKQQVTTIVSGEMFLRIGINPQSTFSVMFLKGGKTVGTWHDLRAEGVSVAGHPGVKFSFTDPHFGKRITESEMYGLAFREAGRDRVFFAEDVTKGREKMAALRDCGASL